MRRVYLVVAACIIGGLIIGASWPPPPIPRQRDDVGQWSLPPREQIARFSSDAFTEAGKLRWRADASEGGDAPSAAVAWQFAGLTEAGRTQALVIEAGTRQARRLVAGELLPDGSRLVSIDRDTITVDLEGCTRVYQMHRKQPIRSSGSCDVTPAASE